MDVYPLNFLPQNIFYYSKDERNNTNLIENKKSDKILLMNLKEMI